MPSIETDSGNLGAVIHSRRQTHLRWDYYWQFPVPEGLTGIDLTCLIDQTSLLDGNIAMCPPGVDPENALDTTGGVTFYEIPANSEKCPRYFSFREPGIYTFVMRGNYAYVDAQKFSKVEELHQKGAVATEYMNIFITKMHFSDPASPEQTKIANQLLTRIQKERDGSNLPTLEDLERGQAVGSVSSRSSQQGSKQRGIFRSRGRSKSTRKKSRRSKKAGRSGTSTPVDPQVANAQAVRSQYEKGKRKGLIHFLVILAISIGLVFAGYNFFPESPPPSVMMIGVGVYGLIVLYQAQFRYKVSGLWRFWAALVLLIGALFAIDYIFYS